MSERYKIASELEDDIAELECGLTYEEIVKVAIFTAKKLKNNTPMYIGNLNPEWTLWDSIVIELKSRLDNE